MDFTITVSARHAAFTELRTFVDDACAKAGAPRADYLRLMLLIEELFVNTVTHGYGEDSDDPVRVRLSVTPAAIAVEYEDCARPYDPFGVPAPDRDDEDLDARHVGGLGIRLIRTIAEDVGWMYRDGRNCITFRIAGSALGL